MRQTERITLLLAFAALAQACTLDEAVVGPGASKRGAAAAAPVQPQLSDWSTPIDLGGTVNSKSDDADPAISKDGLSLYISTNRRGGLGNFDIWVSQRGSVDQRWGPPQPLGPKVNSAADDLAPAFSPDGHWMYFGSFRPGGCGGADLYVSHRDDAKDDFGWQPAVDLGCVVNSAANEVFPTYFEGAATGAITLYYASSRPGGLGDLDIYVSSRSDGAHVFGAGVPVSELNSPTRDSRTTIRRDGLELILASDRPGTLGDRDLWVATRASTLDRWSTPANLGSVVNTVAREGGPAISEDQTLYLFSDRRGGIGGSDLYLTTRTRIPSATP